MTTLDDALEQYLADENQQSHYYEQILKTDFFVPIVDRNEDQAASEPDSVIPLVVEADEKHYVLMFDTEERVASWSKKPIRYATLAGYELAKRSPDGLHWAINIGSGCAKEFVPEEISWLKGMLLQGG